jgi:signal transduction histidine kinase
MPPGRGSFVSGLSLPGIPSVLVLARLPGALLRSVPDGLTLEQLRGDLSHEPAAKLARLAGLIEEWRGGRFRPDDPRDFDAVLADIERLHLRHARLACSWFQTAGDLVAVLAAVARARALARRAPLTGDRLEPLARAVDSIRAHGAALVERLSARHAIRLAGLVEEVAGELRRELAAGPGGIAVAVAADDGARLSWLPRRDAGGWADVLLNLGRNAAQAIGDRRREGRVPTADPPDTVMLRLQTLRDRGACLEVIDDGIGMDDTAAAAMWWAGRSTHGPHRGRGLTEGKRAFVEERARLEVRSAPGVGTCVRIEIPPRPVPVRAPRPWAMPTVAGPAALALVVLAFAAVFRPDRPVASVRVDSHRIVVALDERDHVLWRRDMGDEVLDNYLGNEMTFSVGNIPPLTPPIVRAPWGRGIVLSLRPNEGPGRLVCLDGRGRTRWERVLRWHPPTERHAGKLKAVFAAPVDRTRNQLDVLAVNVRDADWSATSIQFITSAGESLGAYYHPGQLEYVQADDADGDGRTELVLIGKNNPETHDLTWLREDSGDSIYVPVVVMLEPSRAGGQAYPATRWADLQSAREEGYLLVPPLRRNLSPRPCRLDFGERGAAPVELTLLDGRIYRLDPHLRPVSCVAGDKTAILAERITRPLGPMLYLHDRTLERVDVPIQGIR